MKLRIQLLGIMFLVVSCASIISGGNQHVTVRSNVEGAEVFIHGKYVGKTPFAGSVKRAMKVPIMVKKKGYKTHNHKLAGTFNPWFWGNIILGGTLGSTTDFASKAAFKIKDDNYYIDLEPEDKKSSHIWKERNKVKAFIFANYKHIVKDLHRGQGEYISSLAELISINAKLSKDEVIKVLLSMKAFDSVDPVAFVEEVVTII